MKCIVNYFQYLLLLTAVVALSACGDDDPHYYDEQIAEFAERIRKAVER